jgi:hypothetical protein
MRTRTERTIIAKIRKQASLPRVPPLAPDGSRSPTAIRKLDESVYSVLVRIGGRCGGERIPRSHPEQCGPQRARSTDLSCNTASQNRQRPGTSSMCSGMNRYRLPRCSTSSFATSISRRTSSTRIEAFLLRNYRDTEMYEELSLPLASYEPHGGEYMYDTVARPAG